MIKAHKEEIIQLSRTKKEVLELKSNDDDTLMKSFG